MEKSSIESDSCVATLTFYDGYDETAPVLATLCGEERPPRLYTTGNVVFIKFSTHLLLTGSRPVMSLSLKKKKMLLCLLFELFRSVDVTRCYFERLALLG